MMKGAAILVCLALSLMTVYAKEWCTPHSYEGMSFVTLTLQDRYIAVDYNVGRIFTAPRDKINDGTEFTLMDIKTNKLYNKANGACVVIDFPVSQMFGRCLPDNLKVVGSAEYAGGSSVVQYDIGPLTFTTVVNAIGQDGFIIPTITRTYEGDKLQEVNVHYDNKIGVSDPKVFDQNLSSCVPPPSS